MRSGDSTASTTCPPHPEEECVELAMLLPRWQFDVLASRAGRQGLTVGQLTRRLIRAFLTGPISQERKGP